MQHVQSAEALTIQRGPAGATGCGGPARMRRVLLILPTRSYRAPDFLEAAQVLEVAVTIGSEERNPLTSRHPDGYLELAVDDPPRAVTQARAFTRAYPLDAVLGVDDRTTVAAAAIARSLGLPGNSLDAVEASRDKALMRERLRAGGMPVPEFRRCSADDDPTRLRAEISYPCVIKPTRLSASQGVIRVDEPSAFVKAWERVVRVMRSERTAPELLIESFIPGREVALEGLVEDGRLRVLALFDKPDPLDGPFFEETIYVRPSRLAERVQRRLHDAAERAIRVLGLTTGPVHVELRINDAGVWIIELAARPIGGRCSRALRFDTGVSLEELVMRQALGLDTRTITADPTPSGVLMIPVPHAGTLEAVAGLDDARAVAGIEEILLSAHIGQTLAPPPDGSAYPGFIFARAQDPAGVEEALRMAHARLKLILKPLNGVRLKPDPGVGGLLQQRVEMHRAA